MILSLKFQDQERFTVTVTHSLPQVLTTTWTKLWPCTICFINECKESILSRLFWNYPKSFKTLWFIIFSAGHIVHISNRVQNFLGVKLGLSWPMIHWQWIMGSRIEIISKSIENDILLNKKDSMTCEQWNSVIEYLKLPRVFLLSTIFGLIFM